MEIGKAWTSKTAAGLNQGEECLEKHLATSNLATRLLALSAHGQLSATMICKGAGFSMVLSTRTYTIEIAQAGSCGDQPGNIHKAIIIMRRIVKGCCQADPTRIKIQDQGRVPWKGRGGRYFLPHSTFCQLGKALFKFSKAGMMVENLEKFWKAVEETGDQKLKHHP